MALRNQPYMPLYVQDVLSDEKLVECSAESHGVYFRLLCILHKQDDYGKLYLKAKYKQNESKIKSFAILLSKPLPFTVEVIENSLTELIEEKVLFIDGDFLCQKRMIRDYEISQLRAGAGSKGGKVGRNSGTKRYYNVPGYLYLIYDDNDDEAFKVGISQEPDKRIYGIIRKTQRPNLKFRKRWYVDDMGEAEQIVLDYYDDIRDGEWIYGKYNLIDIEQQILKLIKSKLKANTENESDNEIESDIAIKYSADFLKFWDAYPRKKNKDKAFDYWKRKRSKPPIAEILAKVELQKKSEDWTKDGGKYIPYPGSYINAGGWYDEVHEKRLVVQL
jgi:hypothetical protein